MELFRRTLAGLLMLVVAVSVGIWVQGRFIDAVRLPTHTRMIGATYTTLSDPFYETINDEIQMQIKSNGDLLLVRDPGQDQERQNQEIEDMLNKGIELLIVNPVDYVGVTPALEKAREKGVPVILIDSKVDDPELVTCTITPTTTAPVCWTPVTSSARPRTPASCCCPTRIRSPAGTGFRASARP